MRYVLTAENQIESDILDSQPTVRPLFDPFLPVIQARCIMAAVKLGIFDAMGTGDMSDENLSEQLGMNAETLQLLLRVLQSAGYVSKSADSWSLREQTRMTLLASSPLRLTSWVEHSYFHWKIILRLEDALKHVNDADSHSLIETEEEWRIYQRAMLETARPAAEWVAQNIPIRDGAEKLLDVGGSHGLYGAAICRMHPPMRSEVVDLPQAIAHARELGRIEGITDVVSYRSGDILSEELHLESIGAAFLGNVVHHFTPDQNLVLFRKLKVAIKQEGTIAIWDFKRPDGEQSPDIVSDGLALMFRISSASRCFAEHELVAWLEQAGFVNIKSHPTPAPSQLLLTGRV